MCQSITKKISEIKDGIAYVGSQPVQLLFQGASAGDLVLVYGNLAIRKINKSEAKEMKKYEV